MGPFRHLGTSRSPIVGTINQHHACDKYNVNNVRFTEFLDRYFHIPLPIVTKHELGLPFPPRYLPIKFGTHPSTIFLVIVVTDRHTDRHTQTNAGKNIFPRFRGDNYSCLTLPGCFLSHFRSIPLQRIYYKKNPLLEVAPTSLVIF